MLPHIAPGCVPERCAERRITAPDGRNPTRHRARRHAERAQPGRHGGGDRRSTDQAGDGNAINDQGLPFITGNPPATSTAPAQLEGADILGARITSVYDEVTGEDGLTDYVLTGLEFRTGMTAEPAETSIGLIHRFMGTIGGCEAWVQATTGTGAGQAHGTASVRLLGQACGVPNDAADLPGSVTLTGPWVTYEWDAEMGEMVVAIDLVAAPAELADRVVRGDYYSLADLENRHYSPAGITAPVVDRMPGPGFVVIGDDIPADEEPSAGNDPSATGGDSETGGTGS